MKQTTSMAKPAPWRKPAYGGLSFLYLVLIYCGPALSWHVLYASGRSRTWQLALAFASPFLYAIGFLAISGCLSLYHQKGIMPGRFPRNTAHPVYFHRRLYGLCWTALFYCKPVYALCLSVPLLKWIMFRLFGYRGCMNFTLYPDTWIRDLPLLSFADGVYISNRATLGTNIALASGHILVDRIELEEGALVGHLTMLAPGVRLGRRAETAVGCAIGIGSVIGAGAKILPTCTIEHGVTIAPRVVVGTMSYIGNKAMLANGVQLAPGTLLPRRATIGSTQDARAFVSSSTLVAHLSGQPESSHDE